MPIGDPAVEPAEPAEAEPEASASAESEAESASLDFSSEDMYSQFRASLPEDQRELPIFKDTKSISSLAEQALNAQKMLGKPKLPVPDESWGDNEWNDFYSKLRPETSSDYEFPEKLELKLSEDGDTKEFSFDEDTSNELKTVSHELGLTKRQANQLAEVWAKKSLGSNESLTSQIDGSVKEQVVELQKEWGDQYEVKHRAANEAIETLSSEIPELQQLVEWSPIVANHPAVMKLFERLSPLVSDLGLQGSGNSPSMGFGGETVASIKSEIDSISQDHGELIMSNPSTLSMADRTRREQLLSKRSALYKKLHPSS